MLEKSEFDFNDFNKICNVLNTITKMDVRLIDRDGKAILQLVKHNIPAVLQNFDNEYLTINDILRKNITCVD